MNKEWNYIDETYELYLYPYESGSLVLTFAQDKEDKACFWYTSELLKVEYDYIQAESIEAAQEEFEDMIYNELEDMAEYYGRLVDMFWDV